MNRDQFAIVLATLRARFREGAWVEGEPLLVGDLATQLGVSATPVREALSRLAGEGMVQDQRGRGYHARRLDSVDLADLYRAQQHLARTVISIAARGVTGPCNVPAAAMSFLSDPVPAWEGLLETLVARASSSFLMNTQQRLSNQLAAARRVEPEVLDEGPADFEPLLAALSAPVWPDVGEALETLFLRRRAAVEGIVARMRLRAGDV